MDQTWVPASKAYPLPSEPPGRLRQVRRSLKGVKTTLLGENVNTSFCLNKALNEMNNLV